MSNENQNQPAFRVERIYTKDISFENPNAPQVFLAKTEPKIELNLSVDNNQIGDEHWEITLKVSVIARDSENQAVVFEVALEQAGIFFVKDIPAEHLAPLLSVECPSIIFPYVRQIVSQLTGDGGFVPLLMEPFNFAAAYKQSLMQQDQQATH